MKQKLIVGAIIIAVVIIGMVFLSNKASASENSLKPPSKPPSPLDVGGLKGFISNIAGNKAISTNQKQIEEWKTCIASDINKLTPYDVCGEQTGIARDGSKYITPEKSGVQKAIDTTANVVVPFRNWF